MILQALVDYYEILARDGKISRPGYCKTGVSFALELSEDGRLVSVIPLKVETQRGKKTVEVSQRLEVPEKDTKRTMNVKADFLCDNSGYVLGIDNKGKPERTRQCFDAFKKLHHAVLDESECMPAKAVLCFLDTWEPEKVGECETVADMLEGLTSGANIVFHIAGGDYVHKYVDVRRLWEKHKLNQKNGMLMQCLITGQDEPVALLHPSIKGVKGGKPTGVSFVAFQKERVAFSSYGRDGEQGLNAPVSTYAAFAYTTALNYLLADAEHRQTYGDTTVVYWAHTGDPVYRNVMRHMIDPPEDKPDGEPKVDDDAETLAKAVFKKLIGGEMVSQGAEREVIDRNMPFYILGIAPNAARLSARFFLRGSFGQFIDNMKAHHDALDIVHAPGDKKYLNLWRLMQETVSPSSKDKAASPLLSGAVLRSIFAGQPYPELLFNSVMVRIRAEHDVSRGKAAIIKAYLIRNSKDKYKEEANVSLNDDSQNQFYILGRLFAIMEKVQKSLYADLNSTIKDKYFASASATPARVFPILLKLNSVHLSSLKKKDMKEKFNRGKFYEKAIKDLQDRIEMPNDNTNPYPMHLDLTEQGVFILGYYHQMNAKKVNKDREEEKNDDSEQV